MWYPYFIHIMAHMQMYVYSIYIYTCVAWYICVLCGAYVCICWCYVVRIHFMRCICMYMLVLRGTYSHYATHSYVYTCVTWYVFTFCDAVVCICVCCVVRIHIMRRSRMYMLVLRGTYSHYAT